MQIFEYNKEKDTYTCPADQILKTNGTVYNKNTHRVKHYKNRQACKNCKLRAQCFNNKNGRFIKRSIYQEALEENQQRVESNPQYYRLRQQITEHQFGTLKRQWGFTYTLMKTKQHVLSEKKLMIICYNLRRLMSIFSMDQLKVRLKGLAFGLLGLFDSFKALLRTLIFQNAIPHFLNGYFIRAWIVLIWLLQNDRNGK